MDLSREAKEEPGKDRRREAKEELCVEKISKAKAWRRKSYDMTGKDKHRDCDERKCMGVAKPSTEKLRRSNVVRGGAEKKMS